MNYIQLNLPLGLEEAAPLSPELCWHKWRTSDQELDFKAQLTEIKLETEKLLKIAKKLFCENFASLKEVSTEQLLQVRAKFEEIYPEEKKEEKDYCSPKPISFKSPKTWSIEAKHRNRIRLMTGRVKKKFSLMPLYIDAVQAKLLTNPNYYGVCPLPNSCVSCPVSFPHPEHLQAMAKERELRSVGL